MAVSNGRSSDQPRSDVLVVADPESLPERVDPGTSIVAVIDDERVAARLARMGAAGWAVVPPDASGELLRAAATAAVQGMVVMPASEARATVSETDAHDERDEDATSYEEALTAREREVLELLASGLTNREIAERLAISEHTVKFHVSTIYGKLGAGTRTEAVRRGLVTL